MSFIRQKTSGELGLYMAGIFLLFVLCFFLMYGREAARSGSWRYVINNADEYFYWVTARGAAETPQSDGNPFYYEEKGSQHALPHVAANGVGYLAKFLNVPVLTFFPLWHVGMPCLIWITLFLCFSKVWKYPAFPSAAAALFLMTCTLLMNGLSPYTFVRFPHPGDGLWLLVIWLSLITHLDQCSWYRVAWLWGIAFASFWLQPLYVIPGSLVTMAEGLWHFKRRDLSRSLKAFSVLGAVCLAALLLYVRIAALHYQGTLFLVDSVRILRRSSLSELMPSFLLYGGMIFSILFPKLRNKETLTPLDRLTISLLSVDPLLMALSYFVNFSISISHRYYFLLLEMACVLGIVFQNAPGLFQWQRFQRHEKRLFFLLFLIQIGILLCPALTPFRFGRPETFFFTDPDNALRILSVIPGFFMLAWGFFRFPVLKVSVKSRIVIIGGLIFLTGFGFFSFPSKLINKSSFDAAYRWLDRNVPQDSVVLTASAKQLVQLDYLLLYTQQKSYLAGTSVFSLTEDRYSQNYRRMFMAALLLGKLDEISIDESRDMDEKLHRFRLDYILIDLTSPFFGNVQKVLGGHIREVYRDNTSLIWRVLPSGTA